MRACHRLHFTLFGADGRPTHHVAAFAPKHENICAQRGQIVIITRLGMSSTRGILVPVPAAINASPIALAESASHLRPSTKIEPGVRPSSASEEIRPSREEARDVLAGIISSTSRRERGCLDIGQYAPIARGDISTTLEISASRKAERLLLLYSDICCIFPRLRGESAALGKIDDRYSFL